MRRKLEGEDRKVANFKIFPSSPSDKNFETPLILHTHFHAPSFPKQSLKPATSTYQSSTGQQNHAIRHLRMNPLTTTTTTTKTQRKKMRSFVYIYFILNSCKKMRLNRPSNLPIAIPKYIRKSPLKRRGNKKESSVLIIEEFRRYLVLYLQSSLTSTA